MGEELHFGPSPPGLCLLLWLLAAPDALEEVGLAGQAKSGGGWGPPTLLLVATSS